MKLIPIIALKQLEQSTFDRVIEFLRVRTKNTCFLLSKLEQSKSSHYIAYQGETELREWVNEINEDIEFSENCTMMLPGGLKHTLSKSGKVITKPMFNEKGKIYVSSLNFF